MLSSLILAAVVLAACDPSALETKTVATKSQPQTMDDFEGVDQLGQPFALSEALGKGPVVVLFYRGHW